MLTITLPVKPKLVSRDGSRGVFEIEALYPGYGQTLGNSLRRVLLSSLPGAAITSMKIKGVEHEFSTIPHVHENVVDLMLNVKQVRVASHTDEPQVLTLSVRGEKRVTASMIKAPSQVTVVNPDCYIATLTDKKAELEIEMVVERGLGYQSVGDRRRKERVPIGVIALDALYSPVRRVNYSVEDMRVGEMTNYNKLRFEIETDGTVTPSEALVQAARVLAAQFTVLTEVEEEISAAEPTEAEPVVETALAEASEDILKVKIEDAKLPTRLIKALAKAGIKTIAGLIQKNEEQLLEFEGLGEKAVKDIRKMLGQYGLTLRKPHETPEARP
ncbi:DNA-directed RNA polymerase subunit alpha [Candidatus Parcubacteria bacterium]|nr:DNA-directed RNA polymerase subunit alpha [Candidatus Parcubacteria bacterium]MBI4099269.1 DNA-directed RNA polymerase subunit alpha [Candidatus Parcubacteria bacterium]